MSIRIKCCKSQIQYTAAENVYCKLCNTHIPELSFQVICSFFDL